MASATQTYTLIAGLGKSGLACARFLARRGEPFVVADSRPNPPGLGELRSEMPDVACHCGPFDAALFRGAERVLLSPGIDPAEPVVAAAHEAGVELLNELELFARETSAPVVTITGSNGKSTVTSLLGEMARVAGRDVRIGGNIGTPTLELLDGTEPELYVLELSSFQLELCESLRASVAVVLNVSDDHLDRHGDLECYAEIKQRVYRGDGVMVLNRDDQRVAAMAEAGRESLWFGTGAPTDGQSFGLVEEGGELWFARGEQRLMRADELRIPGYHNYANALAALALGRAAGLPMEAMCQALREFAGLPHRCQWVAERYGVNWYNDSKGTNVGATLAAIDGMPGEQVVLIAGGQGKDQDFTPLRQAVAERARGVVLFGEDAPLIERALDGTAPMARAESLEAAVAMAAAMAQRADSVLFSPACASFDMFANYVARGEAFIQAVEALER